jgi:NRPS condensation-like uncharacterized protein
MNESIDNQIQSIRLPADVVQRIEEVATLAGVTTNDVYAVYLASYIVGVNHAELIPAAADQEIL